MREDGSMTDLNKERMDIELSAGVLDRQIDQLKAEIADEYFDDQKLDDLIDLAIKLGEVYAQRDFLEKAKAQAVPEGFKLVPVELYNFQANRLAEEEFKQNEKLFDMEHRGLSGIEVELRKAKWLVYKAESIKQNYKRLVNWASESGAEG